MVNALYFDDVKKELVIYPLYARLSKEEQEAVFTPTPPGKTKIVVATNIAETSVTIDGITTVIDCGIAKMNFYNQRNFTSSLVPLPVSKSSAEQRTGRAGRTQPGVCYRMEETTLYLVRLGEISLKGLNRGFFEKRLKQNIKAKLKPYHSEEHKQKGRLYIAISNNCPKHIIDMWCNWSVSVAVWMR